MPGERAEHPESEQLVEVLTCNDQWDGYSSGEIKVETVSPMTIMQMIQEVSVRLGQQGLEEKECSPEEWKIGFFSRQVKVCVSRQTASVSPFNLLYMSVYKQSLGVAFKIW